MKRKTIKSSNIKSVGYSINDKVLELEFETKETGCVYHYLGVDLKTVVEFIFAESVGKYFHSNIKNKFKCEKGEFHVK